MSNEQTIEVTTPEGPMTRISRWMDTRSLVMRWILAGPLAMVLALITMAAMPFWWPAGAAGIDNIAMPVVLFPLIWAITVLYPVLDEKILRASAVMTGLTVVQIAIVASAFL